MQNLAYYFPGSILILIAILIVAVPEILVAFVAGAIIMIGMGALYLGHLLRKSEIDLRNVDGWSFYREPYVWRYVEGPVWRNGYRVF